LRGVREAVNWLNRLHVRGRRHIRHMARCLSCLEVASGMENPLYRKFVHETAVKTAEACGCSRSLWPEKVLLRIP
jgi:hypothetical protein